MRTCTKPPGGNLHTTGGDFALGARCCDQRHVIPRRVARPPHVSRHQPGAPLLYETKNLPTFSRSALWKRKNDTQPTPSRHSQVRPTLVPHMSTLALRIRPCLAPLPLQHDGHAPTHDATDLRDPRLHDLLCSSVHFRHTIRPPALPTSVLSTNTPGEMGAPCAPTQPLAPKKRAAPRTYCRILTSN